MLNIPKFFLLALFPCLLLTSCQKELPIPHDFQPRMVLSGVLVPGEGVRVHIASTVVASDTPRVIPVTHAQVALYQGSSPLGSFTHDSAGHYVILDPVEILEGTSYTLRASAEGFPPMEASTTIPTRQNLTPRMLQIEEETRYGMETVMQVEVDFPPASHPAYYAILHYVTYGWQVERWEQDSLTRWIIHNDTVPKFHYMSAYSELMDRVIEFFSEAPFFLTDPIHFWEWQNARLVTFFPDDSERSFGRKSCIFLSNELFLGRGHTVKSIYGHLRPIPNRVNERIHTVAYQLSPDIYKAFRGVAAQESTKREWFVTPLPAYNTVKGGLGYFGGALVHTVTLSPSYGNP